MRDELEQLRDDVESVSCWECEGDVEAVLDAWIARHETKLAWRYPSSTMPPTEVFFAGPECPVAKAKLTTIIVPRDQEPTFMAAAKALDAAVEKLALTRPSHEDEAEKAWDGIGAARATLSRVIEQEERDEG